MALIAYQRVFLYVKPFRKYKRIPDCFLKHPVHVKNRKRERSLLRGRKGGFYALPLLKVQAHMLLKRTHTGTKKGAGCCTRHMKKKMQSCFLLLLLLFFPVSMVIAVDSSLYLDFFFPLPQISGFWFSYIFSALSHALNVKL